MTDCDFSDMYPEDCRGECGGRCDLCFAMIQADREDRLEAAK